MFLPGRALGVALVLSLLFILLLRLVAAPLVLLLIVGVLAVLAYGIYHCWQQYRALRDKGASISELGFTTDLSAYQSVQETWLAARESPPSAGCQGLSWLGDPRPDRGPPPAVPAVIILAVLEGILLLMLIFLRQRIRIAIALLKEASRSGPAWEGEGTSGRGARLDGVIGNHRRRKVELLRE